MILVMLMGLTGRTGGHCFVKDMAAFRHAYEQLVDDVEGLMVLKALEEKNLKLLKNTGKSLDIIREVYGES
jgi:soluble cytochrome b562